MFINKDPVNAINIMMIFILLVLLIQFQTSSYNFLHATDKNSLLKVERVGLLLRKFQVVQPALGLSAALNDSVLNSIKLAGGPDNNEDGENNNESFDDGNKKVDKVSTKMDPKQVLIFQQKLLKLLGMKERPLRDKDKLLDPHVVKYLRRLYNNQLESNVPTLDLNLAGRFIRNANTVRSFYQKEGNEVKLNGLHTHLQFDISSIPSNELITGAELHVPFALKKQSNENLQILVHDVVKVSRGEVRTPISYPVDTKRIKTNSTSFWLSFDVFPAISRLNSQKSRQVMSLAIEIVSRKGNLFLQTEPEINQNHVRVRRSVGNESKIRNDRESTRPILFTFTNDGPHNQKSTRDAKTLSRNYRSHQNQRRRKNHRAKNRKRNLCSRRKMFVDFTDVGWNDWIVAPPGYQAFYCAGECLFPMHSNLNATNHAVIQALVSSMNPRFVPPPCCVPNSYSSLSLLYTDSSDRIVLKNYNEMIVDSCGCN